MSPEENIRTRDKYARWARSIFARALWRHFEKMLEAAEINNYEYLPVVITRVDNSDIIDAYLKVFRKVGIIEAFKAYDELIPLGQKARRYAGEIDVLSGWITELEGIVLDQFIPAIGAVLTTSQEIFITEVNTWLLTEGGNLQNVADALRKRFGSLQGWRSWNIARTEVLSAMNFGSEMGARQTGYEFKKTWLQIQRKGLRDIHKPLHGTSVLNNESFFADGEYLRFPGDPNGSAKNRVNCRCTVVRELL